MYLACAVVEGVVQAPLLLSEVQGGLGDSPMFNLMCFLHGLGSSIKGSSALSEIGQEDSIFFL